MSGAPFAYKTANIFILGLSAGDGCLRDILAADDPDGIAIDCIDDRTDITPASVRLAGIQRS
ncbi:MULTISPECIES: hypothetical protein [unclassified Bradyrhizobium]|uniref:hypothetical protein n=1 Tax=unclassified Bradyrhizobium TaxID=2631580 RepID=UPI00247AAA8D|nr:MULTISPECIES: hypothetical protein [unclassified Bradyrhizobium]WGS19297.1 hypothetical protein MTX22_33555 [Bradyrhizobium sp. ISRA463]WGS26131.1 hypothetical protein MTX19_31060 [Bradyrhizobium sp. ISRA464]